MDVASPGGSRNGSFDAFEGVAHEATHDQTARPNDGPNGPNGPSNAVDDRVGNDANSSTGGQQQAMGPNQVAPVVFNAMCNAVRPTLRVAHGGMVSHTGSCTYIARTSLLTC